MGYREDVWFSNCLATILFHGIVAWNILIDMHVLSYVVIHLVYWLWCTLIVLNYTINGIFIYGTTRIDKLDRAHMNHAISNL